MNLRHILQILAPGLGAAATAAGAEALWQDPIATAMAAAVGAVAAALALWHEPAPAPLRPPEPERRDDPAEGGGRPEPGAAEAANPLPFGAGRVLIERMPQGVLLIDPARRVVFANQRARTFFGALPQGGFPIAALRAPRLLEAIDSARETLEDRSIDFMLARKRELYLAAHVVSLGDDAPLGSSRADPSVLVVLEDETQARRADQLHRDFVANASHELKTPLASVSAIIETLLGHARGDAEAEARFLGMLAAQTDRMKRLIEDLISLNRIEINERVQPQEPQSISRLVHEAVETLRPLAETEGMRIASAAPEEHPTVPGHRDELTQVFVNLIENALRYAKPSDEVRVMLIDADPDRPGMVGIAVEDDGPGIPREHLPRLTERFYRVSVSRSRERGGTGLGLAIVKHIINRHRGDLEIESTIGKGSRFTVWLPVAEARAETGPARLVASADPHPATAAGPAAGSVESAIGDRVRQKGADTAEAPRLRALPGGRSRI